MAQDAVEEVHANDHSARGIIAAVAAVLWLGPGTASATPSLGVDVLGRAGERCAQSCAPWTLGWSFQTTSPILVHALGIWDEGANGLAESHAIGLWSRGGVLLASTTVTPSSIWSESSASGLGQWVFEPVVPLGLDPGSYIIGAVYKSARDNWRFRADGSEFAVGPLLSDPDFTWFAGGSSLRRPVPGPDEAGYFGPNLLVSPEPSTAVLLSGGLLLLAASRSRTISGTRRC